jgi:5'-methylthioadenosine phosphorylase
LLKLGIIGGSGVYRLPELQDAEWRDVDTPWGAPSDQLLFGRLGGVELVFLPRHGRGHRLLPAEINYRANIAALKIAGCTDVVSVTACGSFREELPPGTFVIVDQIIDRTRGRERSFFGAGVVAHVGFADPVCGRLRGLARDAAADAGVAHANAGTLLVMEGPAFSTRAESHLYRAAGLDVIGMTAMPEAALAREAELCYGIVAMVTDFDAWHGEHDAVDVAQVVKVLHENGANALRLVSALVKRLPESRVPCHHGCDRALDHAIITAREVMPASALERLRHVAGRVLR